MSDSAQVYDDLVKVKLVVYHPEDISDDLYRSTLPLVADEESRKKIEKFYHRVDACRSLIGRLLIQTTIRDELARRGDTTGVNEIKFGRTKEGKPYIIKPVFSPLIPFNVTHDNALVGIAWCPAPLSSQASSTQSRSVSRSNEDLLVGVDVMKVALPRRESLRGFIGMFKDQVHHILHPPFLLRSHTNVPSV
jgi:4'-phosphopantetheinyl transferase